jgi:hypothetical protein
MLKKLERKHQGAIVPYLPEGLRRPAELMPSDLVGSTILAIGTLERSSVEGGGLVIDYQRPDGIKHRVVFGCTELGMWVDGIGVLDA